MRLDDCAKVGDGGVIRGRGCTTVFAVFGPYVTVPAKSQVQVTFNVESPSNITVVSDMVSDLGKQFHGSVVERPVAAKERGQVGYRINFFSEAVGLEARIGVHGQGPVDFDITDLVIAVQ